MGRRVISDSGAWVSAGARGMRPDTPQLPPIHSSYICTLYSKVPSLVVQQLVATSLGY